MKSKLSVALSSLALTASLPFATAHAVESVKANELGVVEAPTAGSTPVASRGRAATRVARGASRVQGI